MKTDLRQVKRALAGVLLIFTALFACSKPQQPAAPSAPAPAASATQPQAPAPSSEAPAQIADVAKRDLSKFDHTSEKHKASKCESCHARSDNIPLPKLPAHAACIQCHANLYTDEKSAGGQQFCSICHVWPIEAAQIKLTTFPRRMQQFGLKEFSHFIHMDRSKMPADQPEPKCASCHRAGERVIEVSMHGGQMGYPSHPECYTCHTPENQKAGGSCGVCHALKETAMPVGVRSVAAFTKFRFQHATHLKRPRISRECAKCHRSLSGLPVTKADVSGISPRQGMRHTSSCWSCHVRIKEPVCTKCHLGGPPIKIAALHPSLFLHQSRKQKHAIG